MCGRLLDVMHAIDLGFNVAIVADDVRRRASRSAFKENPAISRGCLLRGYFHAYVASIFSFRAMVQIGFWKPFRYLLLLRFYWG